jgi:flagellar basal body-associated protein FliL
MSPDTIFIIIGTFVAALGSEASLLWWAYRRGQAAGEEKAGRNEDKARIAALEQQLTEIRTELAAFQSKRR